MIHLFRQFLTSTYFLFDGKYYEQTGGVVMGSPLAPVLANFYMEHSEQTAALGNAARKLTHSFKFVNDTW
jgi:hypothetical protein